MATALQGSLLLRHGHPAVADAFAASRLGRDRGDVFGTLPTGLDLAPIIERCTPKGTGETAGGHRMSAGERPAAWREGALEGDDSLYAGREQSDDGREYRTLTYEVTGRIARITFNRPEQGNAITNDTPADLAHAVERADLDPRVHVILLSGRGKGFCGGYDLDVFAENAADPPTGRRTPPERCSTRWCR